MLCNITARAHVPELGLSIIIMMPRYITLGERKKERERERETEREGGRERDRERERERERARESQHVRKYLQKKFRCSILIDY